MKQLRIYVAGPMAKGVFAENMRAAYDTAHQIMNRGHWPFVPHLFWHLELWAARSAEEWLGLDKVWLAACDAIIRLPGASVGADLEMQWAGEHGLIAFYSVGDIPPATERVSLPDYRPLGGA